MTIRPTKRVTTKLKRAFDIKGEEAADRSAISFKPDADSLNTGKHIDKKNRMTVDRHFLPLNPMTELLTAINFPRWLKIPINFQSLNTRQI